MTRVKVHHSQLTLPDEAREKLQLADEDELEVEVVEDGVILRSSRPGERRGAYQRLRAIQKRVRYAGGEPRPDAEEEERQIAELLEAEKRQR